MLAGRICANIRKVQVQGYKDSILGPAPASNRIIICSREIPVADGIRNAAGVPQDPGCFGRKVLVYFESHAVSPAGKSTEPSRANSAA